MEWMRIVDRNREPHMKAEDLQNYKVVATYRDFVHHPSFNGCRCLIEGTHKEQPQLTPPRYFTRVLDTNDCDVFGMNLRWVKWSNLEVISIADAALLTVGYQTVDETKLDKTKKPEGHQVSKMYKDRKLKFLVMFGSLAIGSSALPVYQGDDRAITIFQDQKIEDDYVKIAFMVTLLILVLTPWLIPLLCYIRRPRKVSIAIQTDPVNLKMPPVIYWTRFGDRYHVRGDCQGLVNARHEVQRRNGCTCCTR
jgi:hypothetical protein